MSDNLYSLIESRFPADRSKPCLIRPGMETVSYADLERGSGRLARLLGDLGISPGDRIVVQTPKCAEALMLYLACLKVGAVYTPLNQGYTSAEVDYFISDAEPFLVVRDAIGLMHQAEGLDPLCETVARTGSDLASLIYTSGTTGRSKGAMLSHGALAANGLALVEAWGYSSEDVLLHALPVFHVHGLFVALHCALFTGSSMVWLPGFETGAVIEGLKSATVLMGVPTFYTRLLDDHRFDLSVASGIRLFISGSAPLLEATFMEFERRTGQRILERYGMSEAVIISTNPLRGERRAGSVGYALPGVDIRIAGHAPGDGEAGPIEIRGPSLFDGYWRMPEKTAEEFTSDGYFMTGDVGRMDADGRLWISGRAKDLIISGGYNVYPKEIELALDELTGVIESAVIGVPHPDFGEAVVAAVIGKGNESEMIAALRNKLAAFKTPKRIMFLDELPRNAMGKVQKNVLRESLQNLFARTE